MRRSSARCGTGERGATGSCGDHRGGAAMPRRERPLDAGDGPLVEFAAGLRQLRRKAGNPPYRRLAEQAHYSISTLSSAASGQRLPTLAVTLAYVRACDGDAEEWRERWREA
ncbi:helix-turn-helix domain-containing protein, partial [Streptomyces ipomoeae]